MTSQPFFWEAKNGWYWWTRTATNKRKRVFLARGKKQAWAVWKDMLAASSDPLDGGSFATHSQRWLKRQQTRKDRGEVSAVWLARVTRTVEAFSKANPTVKCSQITPDVATAWLGQCSSAYEHTEVSALKQILKWCVQEQVIASNPLESMKLSKGKRRETILTLDQHRHLVSFAPPQVRCLLWFAWWTGCRPSELRDLQWQQVAKDCSHAILVEHKRARSTGKHRVIYFSPTAVAILKRHRKAKGFVFVNSRGGPWSKNMLVTWMRRLREKSGIEVTAYTYRHSYVTRALEQGVSVSDVAEIAGTSVEMISRNYSHLDKGKQRLADIAAKIRPF
jgi:integrase